MANTHVDPRVAEQFSREHSVNIRDYKPADWSKQRQRNYQWQWNMLENCISSGQENGASIMENPIPESRCSSSIANPNKKSENKIFKSQSRDKKSKINQTFTWGKKGRSDQFSLKTMKQMMGAEIDIGGTFKSS